MATLEEQARVASAAPTSGARPGQGHGSASRSLWIALGLLLLAGGVGYQIYQARTLSQEVATLKAQMETQGSDRASAPANQAPAAPDASNAGPLAAPDLDLDRWDPRAELQRMQKEMNELFGTSFSRFHMSPQFGPLFESRAFSPNVDVEETDDAFVVEVDVPGVSKTNINVEVVDNTLRIRGETNRELETDDSKGEMLRKERFEGRFERAITLPSDVDDSKMTSKYDNGVLTITLPKKN